MQASKPDRAQELERVYQARRGHAPQISISDPSHHVTEAIGDMYGREDDFKRRDSRPLSFVSSPLGESFDNKSLYYDRRSEPQRSPLNRTNSNERMPQSNSSLSPSNARTPSVHRTGGQPSPPPLNRTNSDTAQQQFPLNVNYEDSPAAVAQELSNLQAIRRMSMDVNMSDPDLPSFNSPISIPPLAPSHGADENDASSMYWVPASLHPELAPKEFKTFIEERVEKMRRRTSVGEDSLSPDGVGRSTSGGGLRRKKSMLSKQINSGSDYKDGADRLERKRSGATPGAPNGLENISELEHLVNDPTAIIRRMSVDRARKSDDSGEGLDEDIPILAAKIGGQLLKRSTRTNYRRGSLRKGERVAIPRRPGFRQAETDTEDSPVSSPSSGQNPDLVLQGLIRVQTEPAQRPSPPENFSRPTRKRSPPLQVGNREPPVAPASSESEHTSRQPRAFHSRIASNGRTTASLPGYGPQQTVPQIVETPPPAESKKPSHFQPPARSSSHEPPPHGSPQNHQQTPPPTGPLPSRPPHPKQHAREPPLRDRPPSKPTSQTLEDIIAHPTPLPGNMSTRTDTLSSIPYEDKKVEKKASKERRDGEKKSSWWSFGSDDKEKDKDDSLKKSKSKLLKSSDKTHEKVHDKLPEKANDKTYDNTRLDLLQTSIDGGRGRESLVLDRESVKLDEERKKESNRKVSGNESKKEKESGGVFSFLLGGKKKSEKDSGGKRTSSSRGLSPEPPPKILKPDIDYNWTRFSILEERAIYRMAHIKLANPRRELYSQVLLSNFMYSYLAKVQQMHPQIQIAQSPAQKQQQQQQQQQQQSQQQQAPQSYEEQQEQPQRRSQSRQKRDQPEEFAQYQRYQEHQARLDSPADGQGSSHSDDHDQRRHKSRSNSSQSDYDRHQHSNGYSVASGDRYMGAHGSNSSQPYQQPVHDGRNNRDDMW